MHCLMPEAKCGESLLGHGHDGVLRPKKTFVYHDFKDYLASLLSHADIEAAMDQACDNLQDSINFFKTAHFPTSQLAHSAVALAVCDLPAAHHLTSLAGTSSHFVVLHAIAIIRPRMAELTSIAGTLR